MGIKSVGTKMEELLNDPEFIKTHGRKKILLGNRTNSRI